MSTIAFKEERTELAPMPTLVIYRCLDLLVATSAMIVCAPLLLVLCIMIRLDSDGPSLFRQRRLGRDKEEFTVHKFRTMRVQCDEAVHREYVRQLIEGRERSHSGRNGRDLYKLAADERVTRVGRFLRRMSMDELPQLFDVLCGHMSIVGPRPVIPYEAQLYPPLYDLRFTVKPGITGLWQVNGRNERTYEEMMQLDLEWVRRRSLWLYLTIVGRTPWVLLCRRGVA
jgi:lipopolysaccharide/colanic/teichoic acid biosynthesis glycosyltransferase